MKKLLFLLILVSIWGGVRAQQDPLYSQYMFNQLAYNPAYAGSRGTTSATMLFRKQWWGFSGAPVTANVSLHMPTANERHGFGGNFIHDRYGIIQQNILDLTYAYRIEMGGGFLALGLQGGFTNFANRFSEVTTRDPDAGHPGVDVTAWLPRAGTGIYFSNEKFFAGVSAPNLISGEYFRFDNGVAQNLADRQRSHYFAMMGGIIQLNEGLDFRPSAMFKYVANAPAQLDLNATFFINKMVGLGAGWRSNDGMVFMLEYLSPKHVRFGYAFDLALNEIQTVSAGTHEFMLGLDINWGRSRFLTPRLF